ncbi:MAG TPA: hypothetical protein VHL11_13675 [Phototrophicaceae bacterium]|jgi:hypothetical protein|nr:hypothetical protein [Phototrophicaceae bacterium]
MSLEDFIVYTRDKLVSSLETRDEKTLDELLIVLDFLEEAIEKGNSGQPVPFRKYLAHMQSAIQDYFHDETWKSTISSTEEILESFRQT